MSYYNGPKISTSGLFIYIDAVNGKSYPGSGTVVSNLANSGYTSSFATASMSSTTWANGEFLFDGTNDTLVFTRNSNEVFPYLTSSFTIETWVRCSGLGTGQTLGGIWSFTYGCVLYVNSNGSITSTITNMSWPGGSGTLNLNSSGINLFTNTWRHIVYCNNGNKSSLYVDGVLNASSNFDWHGRMIWDNDFLLGRNLNDAPYFYSGSIASAKIYTRALSPEDVFENYNASKTRFRL
jgi:hypothetical protein